MTYPILFQFWDFINPKVLIKVDELLPMGTVIALTGKIYRHFFFVKSKNKYEMCDRLKVFYVYLGRKILNKNLFSSCCCNF